MATNLATQTSNLILNLNLFHKHTTSTTPIHKSTTQQLYHSNHPIHNSNKSKSITIQRARLSPAKKALLHPSTWCNCSVCEICGQHFCILYAFVFSITPLSLSWTHQDASHILIPGSHVSLGNGYAWCHHALLRSLKLILGQLPSCLEMWPLRIILSSSFGFSGPAYGPQGDSTFELGPEFQDFARTFVKTPFSNPVVRCAAVF